MKYLVMQNTNNESNEVAQFYDINLAKAFVDGQTKDLEEADSRDTDPQTISYEVFDASMASDDPDDDNYPCGRPVYESKMYYNPDC